MSILTISRLGATAVQAAQQAGNVMQPKTFKISEKTDYTPFADMVGMAGSVVYSGVIYDCYALNRDSVIFVCIIPNDGVTETGEISLWNGADLFAIGKLDEMYRKNDGSYLKLYCLVQASGIANAVSMNYAATSPLPKVETFNTLGTPDDADRPVMGVQAGHGASASERGPALVVKSSFVDDDAHWMLVSGQPVYRGIVDVLSGTTFKTRVNALTDEAFSGIGVDLTFVQIVAGAGRGQVRGVTHNNTTGVYTLSSAWTQAPDLESQYEVWSGVGRCGHLNNGCVLPADRITWDTPDVATGPLPVPPELCQAPPPVERSKPPTKTPTVKPRTPLRNSRNTLLGGGGSGQPSSHGISNVRPSARVPDSGSVPARLGVFFSALPQVDPFASGETEQSGRDFLKQRLQRLHMIQGLQMWGNYFNPDQSTGLQRYARPFIRDDRADKPGSTIALSLDTFSGSEHMSVSDFAGAGEYTNMNAALSATMAAGGIGSLLVPEDMRLIVYSEPDMKGETLLNVVGPIYLCDVRFKRTSPFSRISPLPGATVGTGVFLRYQDIWLLDEVWQGEMGQRVPRFRRFHSDDYLTTDGRSPQETSDLVNENMGAWNGSFRVINTKLLGA